MWEDTDKSVYHRVSPTDITHIAVLTNMLSKEHDNAHSDIGITFFVAHCCSNKIRQKSQSFMCFVLILQSNKNPFVGSVFFYCKFQM